MAEENDGDNNGKLADVPLEFFGLMLKEGRLRLKDISNVYCFD